MLSEKNIHGQTPELLAEIFDKKEILHKLCKSSNRLMALSV